ASSWASPKPRITRPMLRYRGVYKQACAARQKCDFDVRFGSKADIAAFPTNVRFTPKSRHCGAALACLLLPKADISPLFDHVVGKLLELCGHLEAQSFSGLQIDNQLEFGRLLDRQFRGLGALENFVYVWGGLASQISEIGAVRHQPTQLCALSCSVDGRQSLFRYDTYNPAVLGKQHRAGKHTQCISTVCGNARKCSGDFLRAVCRYKLKLHTQRLRRL